MVVIHQRLPQVLAKAQQQQRARRLRQVPQHQRPEAELQWLVDQLLRALLEAQAWVELRIPER